MTESPRMQHGRTSLPEYTIRRSARARRVRLTVSPRYGLVVVVPQRFPASEVPAIVERHAAWAHRALARTAELREHLASRADLPVPDRVELPGIAVGWEVVLRPGAGAGVRGRVSDGRLVLAGETADREACFAAIRRAVARAARERLPLMLGGVEAATGLAASSVGVRRQKTRWGSCNSKRAISLNESLAFLPPRLVRYVIVHELAHTQVLDHSPRFWALVAKHDASYAEARRDLRDAWRNVPAWATSE